MHVSSNASLPYFLAKPNTPGTYGKPALEETCKQALEYGKVTYTFVKNRIPVVAEDMGISNENREKNEDRNKGAFVMDAQSMDIDSLLSRSQNLAFGKGKGGDK